MAPAPAHFNTLVLNKSGPPERRVYGPLYRDFVGLPRRPAAGGIPQVSRPAVPRAVRPGAAGPDRPDQENREDDAGAGDQRTVASRHRTGADRRVGLQRAREDAGRRR